MRAEDSALVANLKKGCGAPSYFRIEHVLVEQTTPQLPTPVSRSRERELYRGYARAFAGVRLSVQDMSDR
jgi:hypothetical protein